MLQKHFPDITAAPGYCQSCHADNTNRQYQPQHSL
jgi:hypothetical protein